MSHTDLHNRYVISNPEYVSLQPVALSPPEPQDSSDLTLKPFRPNKFDSDTHLFSLIDFLSRHGAHGRIEDRRPHHYRLTR